MAYVPYVPSPGLKSGVPGKTPASKPAAAKPKAAPVKRATDPYADPQAYIRNAVASLGTPLTDAQIQTNAQSELAPLIKALQDSISAQAASGTAAIGGYTSDLAKHLAGFQQNAQNIYGGAEQSQAASDAALSQKLSGEGGQQAQDLGAKLASINAPGAVNQAVGAATGAANGAGNALYATGGASLANLIASGAAEQSYASKLPGLAGLAGAQQVGNLQGELAKGLADGTGSLQAKVPDIVNSLEGQRADLQGRRATLTQDLNSFFSDRGIKQKALDQEAAALHLPDTALSRARGYLVDKNGQPIGGTKQPLPGYHLNPKGSVVKDAKPKAAPKPKAPPKPPTVNTTLSAANKYLTDNSGNPILKNGQRQPYKPAPTGAAAAPKGPLGLSSKDYQKYTALALGAARNYHGSWTDSNNATQSPLTWQQYLTHGESAGIPVAILIQQGKKVYSVRERKLGLVPGG